MTEKLLLLGGAIQMAGDHQSAESVAARDF